MNLKPYPKYKDSGVAWLGEIPEHWEVLRAKNLFMSLDIRSETGAEELLSVSEKHGVSPRKNVNVTMFQAESYKGYKLCWPGDLVINSLWAWMQGLGFSKYHGIVSSAYGVYRLKPQYRDEYRYFNYLLRSAAYKWELRVRSKGIWRSRYQLTDDMFLAMPILVPPHIDRKEIVAFLLSQEKKINKFIRNKLRLIELLKEQKQNIINRAVTRGLNPDVKLKPSGVEWLGDVPEHWEVVQLKHCITPIEQGWSPQCESQPAKDAEWGVLKVGCVNGEKFNVDQNKKLPDILEPRLEITLHADDILVSRANTRELVGLAAVVERDYPKIMLCDKLFRFRAKDRRTSSLFLVRTIRCPSSRAQIESSTNGASSSMQNIGQGVVRNLWVGLPPLSEQQQITSEVDRLTSKLSSAISRAEREIELIREYRTRLISDVVTGKVDVRDIPVEDVEEEELVEVALEVEEEVVGT